MAVISDEQILAEAVKLVADGVSVTFPVNGRSMLPFIVGGRESVILEKPTEVKVGDVVLAWVDGNRFVVHRVIRVNGDRLTLMGDGNLSGYEHCSVTDVKALATHVVNPKGRKRNLYTTFRRVGALIWRKLRFARRWLLLAYRAFEKLSGGR